MESVEGFGLLRYQFEPECAGGEPVSAEEASENSDSDTELGKESEHEVWRVGNHDWHGLVYMRVVWSYAKRREKVTVARNWMSWKTRDPKAWLKINDCYFPSFIAWHEYSFSAFYSLICNKTEKGCHKGEAPFNLKGGEGYFEIINLRQEDGKINTFYVPTVEINNCLQDIVKINRCESNVNN